MPAHEHLSKVQFKVYHGTPGWNGDAHPSASYDRPFHVASTTDYPSDHAFDYPVGGYDAAADWDAMNTGHIREYDVSPDAKIHHTVEGHHGGVLSPEEQAHVRSIGADLTMFKGSTLGVVYNPDVLTHKRNIGLNTARGTHPEDEMDYLHGADWRDYGLMSCNTCDHDTEIQSRVDRFGKGLDEQYRAGSQEERLYLSQLQQRQNSNDMRYGLGLRT